MTETDPRALAERIANSVDEQLDNQDSSRRGFLGRSALAGGTLLALGGGAGLSLAQEEEDDTAEEMTANFDDVSGTDIDVLNYALSLEHLESVFYREALDTFDESDFVDAEALEMYDEGARKDVFARVQTIAEHEATHVEVLTEAVELLGGEPTPEATYDFGIESVTDFLALGEAFENTGVAAYAGAAPYVESPDLLGAALSIHSVEARHAALFNELNGGSPFPDAFDPASSQQEVLDAVTPFIVAADEEAETPSGNETETPSGNETQ